MAALSDWLKAFNEQMGREGVPYIGRPLRAWSEWSRQTGQSFDIADPRAQQIFAWLEAHAPAGSLDIPAVFTGAFYFDAYFWSVHIPMLYGTVLLNARPC